ncbi:MAG: ABC transporter permease [bacterium]|nr:ABC transporter permease [bacterium]
MISATDQASILQQVADERQQPVGFWARLALRPTLIRFLSVLVFLLTWELVSQHIDPILFAGPVRIAEAFWRLSVSGELPRQLALSLSIFLVGLVLASVIGLGTGLAMGRYRLVEYLIDPYINALYATPRIALVPLLILWLGLDTQMKIFVVFMGSFFPIVINTSQGVKNVSSHYVEVARAYGTTEQQVFRKVILPSAAPFIMAGFRLGVGRALVGMVVAELLGTLSGLGAMVDKYSSEFDTSALFVPIIVLAFLGVTVTAGVKQIENRVTRWKETERAQV